MPIPTGKRVGRLQKQINITANRPEFLDTGRFFGSLSKRTDAKILIIIFKLLDGSLIVFLF